LPDGSGDGINLSYSITSFDDLQLTTTCEELIDYIVTSMPNTDIGSENLCLETCSEDIVAWMSEEFGTLDCDAEGTTDNGTTDNGTTDNGTTDTGGGNGGGGSSSGDGGGGGCFITAAVE